MRAKVLEFLCDTRANCFIVNDYHLLHDRVPYNDLVGITSKLLTKVKLKGKLYFTLKNENNILIVKITNIPCIKSNHYNSFPLTPY